MNAHVDMIRSLFVLEELTTVGLKTVWALPVRGIIYLYVVLPHTRMRRRGRGSPLTPKVFLLRGLAAPSLPKAILWGGQNPSSIARTHKLAEQP